MHSRSRSFLSPLTSVTHAIGAVQHLGWSLTKIAVPEFVRGYCSKDRVCLECGKKLTLKTAAVTGSSARGARSDDTQAARIQPARQTAESTTAPTGSARSVARPTFQFSPVLPRRDFTRGNLLPDLLSFGVTSLRRRLADSASAPIAPEGSIGPAALGLVKVGPLACVVRKALLDPGLVFDQGPDNSAEMRGDRPTPGQASGERLVDPLRRDRVVARCRVADRQPVRAAEAIEDKGRGGANRDCRARKCAECRNRSCRPFIQYLFTSNFHLKADCSLAPPLVDLFERS